MSKDKAKRRKLTGEELAMAMKVMEARKGEVKWLEYQIEYHDLMLKTGLEMNHQKNIRDFKAKKNEHKENLAMTNELLKILQDQIRNGVEIKKEVEEGEDKNENKTEKN